MPPAMLGINVECPKCQHQFPCCVPTPSCCNARRTLHALTGGGLVAVLNPTMILPTVTLIPAEFSSNARLRFMVPAFTSSAIGKPGNDLRPISNSLDDLHLSGWYYERFTYDQSHALLQNKSIGTFLVRQSSDYRYLFSLSVQTERGPTSVRIHFIEGRFRLDSQPHLQSEMPVFPSVIELIQYYVNERRALRNNKQVWVDTSGAWYSNILLEKPLRKIPTPPSLKHLARLSIHKGIQATRMPSLPFLPPPHAQLGLPPSLTDYLAEYPYSI